MNNKSFLGKLERKYGKYAIPNLTMYMIGLYVIGLLLNLMPVGFYEDSILNRLTLDMNAIFHGEVWRLLTFLMIPPNTGLLVIITLFFYASIGQTLERTWGTFYYNVYIIGGILFTILGNVLAYLIMFLATGQSAPVVGTNYYILLSMFLAFAMLYPDVEVLLMFIIPIKVKWMAYGYYAVMAYQIYNYLKYFFADNDSSTRAYCIGMIVSIVMSLLNFFIYYRLTQKRTTVSRAQKKRKKQFQAKMVQPKGITRHKCAVCGATEETNPELEFRFCSRCNGNYEYCQNHLFTHEHVK